MFTEGLPCWGWLGCLFPYPHGVLPSRNIEPELAQNRGKGNDTWRSGTQVWAQTTGEQGVESIWTVLPGTQFAGQRTWNIHGQEDETSSCFGHSWADGETGRPSTQSFTSANDPTSYIPICEMGTVRPTWLSEEGHGKGFVTGEVLWLQGCKEEGSERSLSFHTCIVGGALDWCGAGCGRASANGLHKAGRRNS